MSDGARGDALAAEDDRHWQQRTTSVQRVGEVDSAAAIATQVAVAGASEWMDDDASQEQVATVRDTGATPSDFWCA